MTTKLIRKNKDRCIFTHCHQLWYCFYVCFVLKNAIDEKKKKHKNFKKGKKSLRTDGLIGGD